MLALKFNPDIAATTQAWPLIDLTYSTTAVDSVHKQLNF